MNFKNKKVVYYLEKYFSLNNIYNNPKAFITLSKLNEEGKVNNFLIVTNANMIEDYYKSDKLNIIKLLYFNKENIHNILYELEKEIIIDGEPENLSFYFYLSLLIRDQPTRLNYYYSLEYIKKVNRSKNRKNNLYYKVIMSKIIIELINNYKGKDHYNDNGEIEIMESDNKKILEENLDYFNNEFNLNWNKNYIIKRDINILYKEIIKELILKNKFEDYDYTYNIIYQLGIESINITNIIFNEIQKLLNSNKE